VARNYKQRPNERKKEPWPAREWKKGNGAASCTDILEDAIRKAADQKNRRGNLVPASKNAFLRWRENVELLGGKEGSLD